MPTAHSREGDRERAREIAERGLILRTTVGSVVHGLSNPGTDDRDEMGICVEPPEYLLGFRRFEHFVYRTQPEGSPSGPGDLDLTVYGLRKWCQLALNEVRAGEVPLDEVLRRLDAVAAELDEASRVAGLPAKPDVAAVDAFLVGAYRRAWDQGLTAS